MTMSSFFLFFSNLAEAMMFFLLFEVSLKRRKNLPWFVYILACLLLAGGIFVVNQLFLLEFENILGIIVLALGFSFIYEGSIKARISFTVLALFIGGIVELVVLYFMTVFLGVTVEIIVSTPAYQTLGVIISKVTGLAVCNIIRLKAKKSNLHIGMAYWLMFFVLFATSVLADTLLFRMSYLLSDTSLNSWSFICSCGLLLSMFFSLYLYERLAVQSDAIYRQRQNEQHLKDQVQHLDEMILKQNEMKRFRHEMGNQLIVLKELIDQGELIESQAYIDKFVHSYKRITPAIDTGNTALDAILSTKKALAESKGISFTMQLHIQENLPVDATDVCIIFGNALDNAIEACERAKVTAPCIDLVLQERKDALFCKLVNTAPASDALDLTTSKKDRHHHGYGIQNMKEALSHYDSVPVFRQEGTTFTLLFQIFLEDNA